MSVARVKILCRLLDLEQNYIFIGHCEKIPRMLGDELM